ncbi:MAG: hypothetical protein HYV02_07885 [Deltaproteobacteria bacterium]|nr:hypothetical protein [Deltaproteobacteria bacterium]
MPSLRWVIIALPLVCVSACHDGGTPASAPGDTTEGNGTGPLPESDSPSAVLGTGGLPSPNAGGEAQIPDIVTVPTEGVSTGEAGEVTGAGAVEPAGGGATTVDGAGELGDGTSSGDTGVDSGGSKPSAAATPGGDITTAGPAADAGGTVPAVGADGGGLAAGATPGGATPGTAVAPGNGVIQSSVPAVLSATPGGDITTAGPAADAGGTVPAVGADGGGLAAGATPGGATLGDATPVISGSGAIVGTEGSGAIVGTETGPKNVTGSSVVQDTPYASVPIKEAGDGARTSPSRSATGITSANVLQGGIDQSPQATTLVPGACQTVSDCVQEGDICAVMGSTDDLGQCQPSNGECDDAIGDACGVGRVCVYRPWVNENAKYACETGVVCKEATEDLSGGTDDCQDESGWACVRGLCRRLEVATLEQYACQKTNECNTGWTCGTVTYDQKSHKICVEGPSACIQDEECGKGYYCAKDYGDGDGTCLEKKLAWQKCNKSNECTEGTVCGGIPYTTSKCVPKGYPYLQFTTGTLHLGVYDGKFAKTSIPTPSVDNQSVVVGVGVSTEKAETLVYSYIDSVVSVKMPISNVITPNGLTEKQVKKELASTSFVSPYVQIPTLDTDQTFHYISGFEVRVGLWYGWPNIIRGLTPYVMTLKIQGDHFEETAQPEQPGYVESIYWSPKNPGWSYTEYNLLCPKGFAVSEVKTSSGPSLEEWGPLLDGFGIDCREIVLEKVK